MEFSEKIKTFLNEHFSGVNIYDLSLEELTLMRQQVADLRSEYFQLEMAYKVLGNAGYGSAANAGFYFYNVALAGDITGECRNLTKTMWHNLEHFFHEEIWERKDLWKEFGFELDESKHEWYRTTPVSIYSDTDSVYTTYGNFFKCWTPETYKLIDTDRKKIDWILNFNKKFQDGQNTKWCEEIYNPRHGDSVHVFELESIQKSQIGLKKKKYLKGYSYVKGKYFDPPKISGTGIEIIKSTTPKLCRSILTDLMKSLMFEYAEETKEEYLYYFNDKLKKYKKEFWNAPIDDISQSVGVGDYQKYVIDDTNGLVFEKQCPVSVKSVARFNYLAHKNHEDNLKFYSGKIKYYNIRISGKGNQAVIDYFGFPAGECPSWAPQMDKTVQWKKTVIDPINRFLEVMGLPLATEGNAVQLEMFNF